MRAEVFKGTRGWILTLHDEPLHPFDTDERIAGRIHTRGISSKTYPTHADAITEADRATAPPARFRVRGGRNNHLTKIADSSELIAWCGASAQPAKANIGENRPDCWTCLRKQATS